MLRRVAAPRALAPVCMPFWSSLAAAAPAQPDPPALSPVPAITASRAPAESVRILVARRGDTLTRLLAARRRRAGARRSRPSPPSPPCFRSRRLQPGHEVTAPPGPQPRRRLAGPGAAKPQPGRTVTVTRTHRRLAARRSEEAASTSPPGACPRRASDGQPDRGSGHRRAAGRARRQPGAHAGACDVDFQREVEPGDGFTMLFERFRDADGRPAAGWRSAARRIPPGRPRASRSGGRKPQPGPNGSTRRAAACAAPSSAPRWTAPAVTSGFGHAPPPGARLHPHASGGRFRRPDAAPRSTPRRMAWWSASASAGGYGRDGHAAAPGRRGNPLRPSLRLRPRPEAGQPCAARAR